MIHPVQLFDVPGIFGKRVWMIKLLELPIDCGLTRPVIDRKIYPFGFV